MMDIADVFVSKGELNLDDKSQPKLYIDPNKLDAWLCESVGFPTEADEPNPEIRTGIEMIIIHLRQTSEKILKGDSVPKWNVLSEELDEE
jgi:hypothetical protein